ncbi:hypothetical protein [Chamaesiphon sp. GL140_3_metabinner_50]|uniref:hypothetical protein n=1 Tax=Chamaesiphon sp. GL140_3_metabinner_50 TaxID=2970812 RepID=UPI0025CF31E8|nr:hypothetical protein [Chamaesiphon sp. GL140_3_metabinner_50]
MKNSLKFAAGLVLVAGALVASGNAAQAGEGGAAGSVSILFGAPGSTPATANVARLSSSVAVGKGFSAATSLTSVANQTTATSAVGSGGGFVLTNANSTAAAYATVAETTVVTDQANTFAGGSAASLRPLTGVTLP